MESQPERNYINELIEAQESNAEVSGLPKKIIDNKQSKRTSGPEIADLVRSQYTSRPIRNNVYIEGNQKDKITGQPYDSVDEEIEYLMKWA